MSGESAVHNTVDSVSKQQPKDYAEQLEAAKAQEEVNLVVALRMYRQVHYKNRTCFDCQIMTAFIVSVWIAFMVRP